MPKLIDLVYYQQYEAKKEIYFGTFFFESNGILLFLI